jgi:hypothetical protein
MEGTIELSFYSEYTSHIYRNHNGKDLEYDVARPVPFDMDGDGIIEAVVVPSSRVVVSTMEKDVHHHVHTQQDEWSLKVLDLRPLHATHPSFHKNNHIYNQYTMLPIRPDAIFKSNAKSSVPVKISAGQIMLRSEEDKTYLCGKARKDANEKCTFTRTEAETAAAAAEEEVEENETFHGQEAKYIKNRWQGIPSVATLWSDGNVTLHGITNTKDRGLELDMIELWNVNPFQSTNSWIDFTEVGLLLENDASIGRYGALILAAKYYMPNDDGDDDVMASMYIAFDLLTGEILWSNESQKDMNHDKVQSDIDCNSLINKTRGILPHAFSHQTNKRGSIERDTLLLSTRIYPHDNPKEENGVGTTAMKSKHTRSYWLVNFLTQTRLSRAKYQRHPSKTNVNSNAIIFHHRHGVDVLSAKGGQNLCRQSLLENVVHADLNSDGIMEHLHFESNSKFQKSTKPPCESTIISNVGGEQHNTTIHLCEDESVYSMFHQFGGVSAALPLLVESDDERGTMTYDIVYALNNGIVKRFDFHGHCKWTSRATNHDFPSWDAASPQLGHLSRIDSRSMHTYGSTSTSTAPFALTGDDKIALFTIGRGRLLDQISLPQMSVWKPILSDMNGDGTTDVLIVTTDGIWGYCVQITAIGSTFLWIMNAFLFLFLFIVFMVAFLDETSQDFPRSTDCLPDM